VYACEKHYELLTRSWQHKLRKLRSNWFVIVSKCILKFIFDSLSSQYTYFNVTNMRNNTCRKACWRLCDTMNATGNNPGPVTRTVCVSNGGDCCGKWSNTTEVKFCTSSDSSSFYIYKLKRVPFCDMAYCADNVPNSHSSKPYTSLFSHSDVYIYWRNVWYSSASVECAMLSEAIASCFVCVRVDSFIRTVKCDCKSNKKRHSDQWADEQTTL